MKAARSRPRKCWGLIFYFRKKRVMCANNDLFLHRLCSVSSLPNCVYVCVDIYLHHYVVCVCVGGMCVRVGAMWARVCGGVICYFIWLVQRGTVTCAWHGHTYNSKILQSALLTIILQRSAFVIWINNLFLCRPVSPSI